MKESMGGTSFIKPPTIYKNKTDLRGTDKIAVVVFVNNILTDFEDFHGITIKNVRDLQKINRVNYLKCLLQNFMDSGI